MLQQGSTAWNGCLKPDGSPPRKSHRVIEARPHAEQPELLYILLTYFALQCPYFSANSASSHLLFSHSVVSSSATPWTIAHQSSLHYLPEFAQTHVHWVGDAIQPSHPLPSPPFLPSIFPSFRVFFNESALCIRWPNYWSFSISLSNEYSGLISFRIAWFDLLAVQGTLKSLLQHHGNLVINSSNDSFKNMK